MRIRVSAILPAVGALSVLSKSVKESTGQTTDQHLPQIDRPRQHAFPPLDAQHRHIRLFRLEPSHRDGRIRCKSSSFDLDKGPWYFALSYRWGDDAPEDRPEIEVNGELVSVSSNLWAFLKVLEQRADQPLLWSDQISINQRDLEEKSRQVRLMSDIFGQAQAVLAWIYDSALGSRPYITHFARSAYWERRWIIQELLLARKISFFTGPGPEDYYDEHEIMREEQWDNFRRSFSPVLWRIAAFRAFTQQGNRPLPMMELLRQFKEMKCERVHDRIYSLLAISAESRHKSVLEVDYESSKAELFFSTLSLIKPDARDLLNSARSLSDYLGLTQRQLQDYTNQQDVALPGSSSQHRFHLVLDPLRSACDGNVRCKTASVGYNKHVTIYEFEEDENLDHDPKSSVRFEFLDRVTTENESTNLEGDRGYTFGRLTVDADTLIAFMYPGLKHQVVLDVDSCSWSVKEQTSQQSRL